MLWPLSSTYELPTGITQECAQVHPRCFPLPGMAGNQTNLPTAFYSCLVSVPLSESWSADIWEVSIALSVTCDACSAQAQVALENGSVFFLGLHSCFNQFPNQFKTGFKATPSKTTHSLLALHSKCSGYGLSRHFILFLEWEQRLSLMCQQEGVR